MANVQAMLFREPSAGWLSRFTLLLDRPAVACLQLARGGWSRLLILAPASIAAVAVALLLAGLVEHGAALSWTVQLRGLVALLEALAVAGPAAVIALSYTGAPLRPRAALLALTLGLLHAGLFCLSLVPLVTLLRLTAGSVASPLATSPWMPAVAAAVTATVFCRVVAATATSSGQRAASYLAALILLGSFALKFSPPASLLIRGVQ